MDLPSWVLLKPAEDVPGVWLAHALELDIVTQGESALDAYRMMAEAVELTVASGYAESLYRRAPAECWADLLQLFVNGELCNRGEFARRLEQATGEDTFAAQVVFSSGNADASFGLTRATTMSDARAAL